MGSIRFSKRCEQCGSEYIKPRKTNQTEWNARRFCTLQCYYDFCRLNGKSGADHPAWKGGRTKDQRDGYVRIAFQHGDEDYADMFVGQYVLEHRLVMARALGRSLTRDEDVHHRNGIRDDNRMENLELRKKGHGPGATKHCLTCTCEAAHV